MKYHEPDNPAGLSSLHLEEIDRICLEFEESWQLGEPPDIQEFLQRGKVGLRGELLRELVLLDTDYRHRLGQPLSACDYLHRFPEATAQIEAIFTQIGTETVNSQVEGSDTAIRQGGAQSRYNPSKLGRYRITEQIGSGAFSRVFKAYDEQLHRHVAIKIPNPGVFTNADAREMFLREARDLATLRHPAIVPVHDIGFEQDTFFIVSDYMEGGNLADSVKLQPPSFENAARVIVRIAEALHYAHGKGLVHRDVKLSNILLDSDGKVYLADFGLALRQKDVGTGAAFAGTPANMSPEQARGDSHLVDGRTDVYSLGVVLYELLAGKRPFESKNVDDLLEKIERHEATPLRKLQESIPLELERVCMKALSKRPADRYSTAGDMADDLQLAISRNFNKPKTRKRGLILTAFVLATALIFGGIRSLLDQTPKSFSGSQSPDLVQTLAVLPFQNGVNDDPYLGHGFADTLIAKLSGLRQIAVVSSERLQEHSGSPTDSVNLAKELQVDLVLEGSILQISGRTRALVRLVQTSDGTLLWESSFDEPSIELFSLQDAIASRVIQSLALQLTSAEQDRVEKRPTGNRKAYEAYVKGRYHWNQRANKDGSHLGQAISFFQEAIAADPLYAMAYSGLAECFALLNLYNSDLDATAYPRARAAAEKALELDEGLSEARATLAFVMFYYDWDRDSAEREFKKAIELKPNYATAHQWYAELLYFSRRFDESIQRLKRAEELDPLSPVIAALQATPYMWQRDFQRARLELEKARQRYPESTLIAYGTGLCLEQELKWDEALECYRKSANETGKGYVLARMGDESEARNVLKGMMSRQPYPEAPYNIALIHLGLGDLETALEWLEKARLERDEHIAWLLVDPRLDPLRDDPRFHKLLKDTGWER